MRFLILIFISLSASAGMFYPKKFIDGQEHPGEQNFVEKSACEKHYGGECMELPGDFHPKYFGIADGKVVEDFGKKRDHMAAVKVKDDAAKAEEQNLARIKAAVDAGQELSKEDLAAVLKKMLR